MSCIIKEAYRNLIDKNHDIFSRNDNDIGAADVIHDIKLSDYSPFKSRPYRILTTQIEIVESQVQEMLNMGIIRPSASQYASPIVLVKKSDRSMRFCIDYRKLNASTIKDNYPMPLIEERIDSIFGSKVFSDLDLTSGYWQFAMASSAIRLTAFICSLGLFEFLRLGYTTPEQRSREQWNKF